MVEVHKERPVDQPCPGVELSEGGFGKILSGGRSRRNNGGGASGIDSFAESVEIFEGDIPASGKDVRCKFAPLRRKVGLRVGRKHKEVVQVIGCSTVVSVGVLKLSKVVEGSDLFGGDLKQYRKLIQKCRTCMQT